MKKYLCVALVFAVLLSALLGCSPSKDGANAANPNELSKTTDEKNDISGEDIGEPKKGGVLKIACISDLQSSLWYELRITKDYYWANMFYEPLLMFDANGDPQPYLAESIDEDAENLRYIIKLREGILFHDGEELTAEVCKWNLDFYKENGVLRDSAFSSLKGVEVLDTYTVALNLYQWDSIIPSQLARSAGFMVSQKAYEEMGDDAFAKNPIGTGPFKWDSRENDVKISFVKFSDYWQGEPLLDGVEMIVIAEDSVAMAALEAGEIHAFFPVNFDIADYMKDKGYKVVQTAIPDQTYTVCFDMSHEDDPFSNLLVRQAAAYALDGESIAKAVWSDYAQVTNQYALPGTTYYNEVVENYPYNPEKAKEILAEAGYPDGFDTRICISSGSGAGITASEIVAQQLTEVGIRTEIVQFDPGQWSKWCDDWYPGMFGHMMTYANGVPSILVMNFRQGLSNVLGTDAFVISDKLNETVSAARALGGEEAVLAYQEAQKIIFEDECMMKMVCAKSQPFILSPAIKDSTIGEISGGVPDNWHLYTAWLDD